MTIEKIFSYIVKLYYFCIKLLYKTGILYAYFNALVYFVCNMYFNIVKSECFIYEEIDKKTIYKDQYIYSNSTIY